MHRFLFPFAAALALLSASVPVLAQTPRPERPYRGLFASGAPDEGLTAKLSLGGGYDDNLWANATGRPTAGIRKGRAPRGVLGNARSSLDYTVTTDAWNLTASAFNDARYYPSLEDQFVQRAHGAVSGVARVGRATSLTASASAGRQPYGYGALFATRLQAPAVEELSPDLDLAASQTEYFRYGGDAGVSQRLSRRASLSGSYMFRAGQLPDRRFRRDSVGGGLVYTLAKGLDLDLGYRYAQVRYASGAPPVPTHLIDAGVNYKRTLSFSRRTTASFQTGSTAVSVQDKLHFRATGHAALNHEIGRSWNASASYGRRVLLDETLQEPVFSDFITAALSGLITRRLQWTTSAKAAIGKVGLYQRDSGFDSYYGTTDLVFAVTRFMGIGMTYSYYHYRFDEGVQLPEGSGRSMDRQSVRVQVTLWTPLFQHVRRSDATR